MSRKRTDIAIKNYLPHEEPMLMVDVIEQMCSEEVITNFYVSENCIFLKDNRLNETGLIENAAQTCSAISGQHYFDDEQEKMPHVIGFISSIKKITIHDLPVVGTKIQSKAQLVSLVQTPHYSICTFKVVVYHLSNLFLEGEMNLFLQKENHEKG